ncbi:hypothetical protein ABW20_dc0105606 [Dactylellina cionopaga]|nr:hypothetical protein ABW20_dc0105606 [Dactylellina cionopaga]
MPAINSKGQFIGTRPSKVQLKLQIRRNQDDERPRIPYWFHPENWLKKEPKDLIYGDERDLEKLPQAPAKKEWWIDAQYPAGKEPHEPPLLGPQPPEQLPEPPRPRNYLSNLPITSQEVYRRLFGKESRYFHDFMRESRVERQFTLGKLLVDTAEVRMFHEYWLQLLRFRARIHGEKGVKDVWTGLSMRKIELPVKGPLADEMWGYFIKVGLEDEDFLNKLYAYHVKMYFKGGQRRWKPMYAEVVGGLLSKKPLRALRWHYRLIDMNPPKKLVNFFLDNASNLQNLPTLHKIFSSKKIGPLYATIIPFFCRQELFGPALQWHKMLFRKGDIPGESFPADRILEYYAFHMPMRDIEETLQEFHKRGIKIMEGTAISLIKARYRTREIMEMFCRAYDASAISNDCFKDKFWAFLLTYQRFSDVEVTEYMTRLGVERIGELTTREFVKRGKTVASFIRGISLLNRQKIEVNREIYDRFLEVKARYHPEEALEESLPIEGLEVSRGNALLQGYLSTYRWKFFNHVYLNLRRKNPVTWNLFLRRLFMTRQTKPALELMEEMRALSIPIRSSGQRELLRAILLPRRPAHHPITQDSRARETKDLHLATNYLRALLINGEKVDPVLWREILKRYGMFRKLKDLERLCLWLVDWYDPRKAALRQTRIPIKFTDVKQIASLGYSDSDSDSTRVGWTDPPVSESNRSPQNPLRILFPAAAIRSFVEWGFISMQRSWFLNYRRKRRYLNVTAKYARCAWGIRLARKLQKKGVWVDQRSVARAIRVRLRALDGSRYHWESFDTNMSKHQTVDLGVMAVIAEKAWGEQLFPKGSWDTIQGLSKILRAPVRNLILRRPRIRRDSNRLPQQHTSTDVSSQLDIDVVREQTAA